MLVSIVLLAGCIKENYDDCERCKLTFSYTGDVNYDIFQQKISCVSLYVFDDKNSLVQTKRIEQSDLKAYQGHKIRGKREESRNFYKSYSNNASTSS